MKRILIAAIVLALGMLLGLFAYHNATDVELNYLLGHAQVSLAAVCGVAFAIGAVFAWICLLPALVSRQQRLRRLQRTMSVRETELNNLRNLPIKDVP